MYQDELSAAVEAARQAAAVIINVYSRPFEVEIKSDDSPVTEADKKSDALIRRLLGQKYPRHSFLTEEGADDRARLTAEYVWIIDPLDGTKDFVDRDGEFAINIALVHRHTPVVAVVAVPVTGEIFCAIKGEGAWLLEPNGRRRLLKVSDRLNELILLSSVYHENTDEKELAALYADRIAVTRHVGSAIKACRIASGEADVSFRFNPNTKEWDTCAPQLLVEEAGGFFTEPDGSPITYNREDVYNRRGFAIYNRPENAFAQEYLRHKNG